MRLSVSLFPNNELRVSLNPEPRVKKEMSKPETHETQVFLSEKKLSANKQSRLVSQECEDSLDISCESETGIVGFGKLPRKTVFGLRGKRTIQRTGGVFDKRFKKEHCVFLTGTLPGSTDESLRAIAAWSGYIVHRLKAWVTKHVQSQFSFYVWEWQRRGALHLHYCVYVPTDRSRQYILEHFHDEWCRLLELVSQSSGTDMFASSKGFSRRNKWEEVITDAQVVTKSVSAYLSKYCSKGHKTELSRYFPSRWWGVSQACRKSLAEMTLTMAFDCLSRKRAETLFEEVISITDRVCIKSYNYRHGSGSGRSLVGYHCPKDSPEDIWKTIVSNPIMPFTNCLGEQTLKRKTRQSALEIKCWAQYRLCSKLQMSAALKAKILQEDFTTATTWNLSIADWRELYSLSCLLLKDSSLDSLSLRIKKMALMQIRNLLHG